MHPHHHQWVGISATDGTHRSSGALQEQSGTHQSTRVWLSKVKEATGSSRHSCFLKAKCRNCKYKKGKATKQENTLLHSLESWTTLLSLATSEHPATVEEPASQQEPNKIKRTNSSLLLFHGCALQPVDHYAQALAHGKAGDSLSCQRAGSGCLSYAH